MTSIQTRSRATAVTRSGESSPVLLPHVISVSRILGIGVVLVAVWWLVAATGALSADLLPLPSSVANEMARIVAQGAFWASVGDTTRSAALGLLIGAVIGLVAGLAIGTSRMLADVTSVAIDFGRSFPIIGLLPVMTLFLGATAKMEITVIAIGAVWPVLVQTVDGCQAVPSTVRDMTRAFRIGWYPRWFYVVLPGAAPYAATAIRVAASLSLLLAVGVEVLGGVPGIGQQIAQAQQGGAAALAFAYVLYTGIIGVALSWTLARIERRLLRWHAASRVAA